MAHTVAAWPFFEQAVVGMKPFDLIDWVSESSEILLSGSRNPNGKPVIGMPPVQRSAVWRPKQVLDLWDSLMRGLPIGTFYLAESRDPDRKVVLLNLGSNEAADGRPGTTKQVDVPGFDLLDGQQRLRALLVGAVGFSEEKRCLWVDFGASEATQRPCLRLTSKAQPFGYDPRTGARLVSGDRRTARAEIEADPEHHPIQCKDGTGNLRSAYDLDLFDGPVTQDGARLQPQPPLPYKTTRGQTFKLPELLRVWRPSPTCDAKGRIARLRAMVGVMPRDEALLVLDEAFSKFERSQIALLRVDSANFRHHDDMLALFERIGAGGTPLSVEERLYSIYKYHEPYIRDAVVAIHDCVGRVLPPTKIAATALRIANARIDPLRNDIPDVLAFSKAMANADGVFRSQLELLIPTRVGGATKNGSLSQSFAAIYGLLSYAPDAGAFWLPDVLLASLPAELWQVLVFWAEEQPNSVSQIFSRQEAVRFALFWHLCVWSHDKAARWAFALIKGIEGANAAFPGSALYERFVGSPDDDRCAHRLSTSDDFQRELCKPPAAGWRTDTERFGGENALRNELGSHWWWNGQRLLPWLQRDYIKRSFEGFVPLSDHEDDLPYDVDHICPSHDWNDWVSVRSRFDDVDPSIQQKMRDRRWAVGGGIGNLRLIESSANRSDQDADLSEKMPFVLCNQGPSSHDMSAMADWAFPPDDRCLWRRVSRPGPLRDRKWDVDRLTALQQAVEQRAAWLYRRYYDDLAYAAWINSPRPNERLTT